MKIDIEYTDDSNIVIYIGQSIFESELKSEVVLEKFYTSFNGLNDKTSHEYAEVKTITPVNLRLIEGDRNHSDEDILRELEIKLNIL